MKTKKSTDHGHSNKYITTQECNKLTSENFAARLAQANLASKNDIATFVKKKTDFDDKLKKLNTKVTSNKTKTCKDWKENNLTLQIKLHKYQKKDMIFCQTECILQAMMVIKISQFLPQCLVPKYQIAIKKLLTGY